MNFTTVIIACPDIQKYLITFLDIKEIVAISQINKSFYDLTKVTKIYQAYHNIQTLFGVCISNRKMTPIISIRFQFLIFLRSNTKKNIYAYSRINKLNDLIEYLIMHDYPNIQLHIEEFDKYTSYINSEYDNNVKNINKCLNVVELQKLLEYHNKIKKKFNALHNF